MAWLAAVEEPYRTVLLGTSVDDPTFRYNPAVVAQAFGTLACLYPERVILGIGTGEALNEVRSRGCNGRVQGAVRCMREAVP